MHGNTSVKVRKTSVRLRKTTVTVGSKESLNMAVLTALAGARPVQLGTTFSI
jgi:hypothetical protein